MKKSIVVGQLEKALSEFKGIEGVRSAKTMLQDLEDLSFMGSFAIITNKRFYLTFNESLEVRFETSFSNQEITPEFISDMMLINEKKDQVGELLQTIYIDY